MQEWLVMGFTTAKRMEADRLSVELDIAANKPMRPPGVDRKGTAQQADGPGLRAAADEDDRSDRMGLQIRAPVGRERPPCGHRLDTDAGALAVGADIAPGTLLEGGERRVTEASPDLGLPAPVEVFDGCLESTLLRRREDGVTPPQTGPHDAPETILAVVAALKDGVVVELGIGGQSELAPVLHRCIHDGLRGDQRLRPRARQAAVQRHDVEDLQVSAHVAKTGHILRIKNRPGNVHDSKQATAFLRELIDAVRVQLGRRVPLEFRMDAAFFQADVLRLLAARGCGYVIKVGYWSWLPVKQLAAERRHWHVVAPWVSGFEHQLAIPQWNLRLRVMIYRTHLRHESPKNFQLDLFTPDDGHFEYSAVATDPSLALPALYAFIGGRGAQEKSIAELKGEFALDVVPTRHYGANSAWQQLSILAHNLALSFQLDTIAVPRRRSRKRTYAYVLRSMRTLRFLLIARAGRLTRIGGRNVLRLSQNPATEALYSRIEHALAA